MAAMDEDMISKIQKYVKMITDGEKIGHALKRLDQMDITLDLLSHTGVGKVVNRLKHHEEFGQKALAIVEKWKRIAKLSQQVKIEVKTSPAEYEERYPPIKTPEKPAKTSSSSKRIKVEEASLDPYAVEPARASSSSKRVKVEDADLDPFAAELAAVDKRIKAEASKQKKAKFSADVVHDLERSLVSNGLPSSSSVSYYPSSATSGNSQQANHLETGMFKPRKDMKKVYAGKRKANVITGPVPRLFDICMKVCTHNIDAIEETGDIPFDILRPILEKCTDAQLAKIESNNPYLEEDGDYLWERHCQKVFPNYHSDGDDDNETWKERFSRFTYERNQKLIDVSMKVRTTMETSSEVPKRQTMLMEGAIAPRHIRKRQIKNGIFVKGSSIPSAVDISKSRRQIFETGSKADLQQMPRAVRHTTSTVGSASSKKPAKRGALMMKTLKMLKGRK